MMRIGFGYDSHRFGGGDHVMIGGVKIPYEKGIIAHSDGDVLLHAVGDALLGAAALGDLGNHFPDNDPIYKSIESSELVAQIVAMLDEKGYEVVNIDSTIVAEAPRLSKFIIPMRENLADLLNLPISAVSVKASTNEKMDAVGRGDGLAAYAVVLIQKKL